MNNVSLTGRLTRDPDIRYKDELAIARFSLAVPRPKVNGKEATSDFPTCVAFGKTAENIGNYLGKGRLVAVTGRIQTGNYTNENGDKVYTTDVVCERVEFMDKKKDDGEKAEKSDVYEGFERLDDGDIPF